MGNNKTDCAFCGNPIEGNNFLGFCSQHCWKQSKRQGSPRPRRSSGKQRPKQYSRRRSRRPKKRSSKKPAARQEALPADREFIDLKEMDEGKAKSEVLKLVEEFAVVGVKNILIQHPETLKEAIRSSEFRKQMGSLGLKFQMKYVDMETQTLIADLSF